MKTGLRLASGVMAAGLGVAGCAPNTPNVHPSRPSAVERVRVDLAKQDPPKSVGAAALNTVSITGFQIIPGQPMQFEHGSGTVLQYKGGKLILTAAHVVPGLSENCAGEEVRYPAPNASASALTGTMVDASPVTAAQHYNYSYNNGVDAATLKPGNQSSLTQYPGLKAPSKPNVAVGDHIFMLGYGMRDPYANPLDTSAFPQQPVMVSGTVIQKIGNKIVFAAAAGQTQVEGDSGGTALDARGYLGDAVAIQDQLVTGTEIAASYGVDVPASQQRASYQIDVVQTVSAATLDGLAGSMKQCQ